MRFSKAPRLLAIGTAPDSLSIAAQELWALGVARRQPGKPASNGFAWR
jgi:hypothetical protein